jgi:tellurium resistance protein TerD
MAINLQKGQRISLAKEAPNLTRIMCGLGWDVVEKSQGWFGGNHDFDLDASVLCLNAQDKFTDNSNLVYFGNLRHKSGAIAHLGDNLTGKGDGDDEQVIVDLPNVPANIDKLVFVVNIYQANQRKQDFSQVKNAFVRLVNMGNNQEIARYELSGDQYSGKTSMIMAEIYRHQNEWKMAAIGNGLKVEGLEAIVKSYI